MGIILMGIFMLHLICTCQMFKNASAVLSESSYLTITEPVSYIVMDPIHFDTEFECKFFIIFFLSL